VVTARVSQKDVPIDITAVGNVEAYNTIAVRTQVTGLLDRVSVKEGDLVKTGDVLFTLDRRPLEAALQQTEANTARDQALLKQAEAALARDAANAEYLQLTAERNATLVARGIVTKDSADQARAGADAAKATVDADKALIASAQAQLNVDQAGVDNARVQLSYTVIPSPLDGRLGDIAVKVGNLVTANTTQLTTISQIHPVFVTFSVPATHLPTIKRHMVGPDKLSVVATPQDADAQPAEGQLTFVDSIVDVTTDTIKLKGTFLNTDSRLWPGQFARVSLRLEMVQNATVVPQQAVQTGQDGQFVFVVNQGGGAGRGRGRGQAQGQAQGPGQGRAAGTDAAAAPPTLTVEQRPVVVAQRVGDDIVIEKGLQPGETVVTEGQLRLEDGTRVQISDANGNLQGGRGARGARGGNRGGQGNQGNQGGGQGQGGQQGQNGQGGQGRGQQ